MNIIFWPTITCWFFSIQIKSLKFYQLFLECEKVLLNKKWNYDPLSMNACTKNTCGRNLIRCKSKTLFYRLNFLWVSLVDVCFLIFQNHTKYQTISHNLIFFFLSSFYWKCTVKGYLYSVYINPWSDLNEQSILISAHS